MRRIVRCSIEMDLLDGEHFNYDGEITSDEVARERAKNSFIDMITQIVSNAEDEGNLEDWVQTEIREEKS